MCWAGLALTASHLIDLLQREGLQAAGGVDEGESDVEIGKKQWDDTGKTLSLKKKNS